MAVQSKEFAETFENFVDFPDTEDIRAYVESMQGNKKECSYCKNAIFDTQGAQSWKSEKGVTITLCAKCNQSYISGLIDPSSDSKKVTKFI